MRNLKAITAAALLTAACYTVSVYAVSKLAPVEDPCNVAYHSATLDLAREYLDDKFYTRAEVKKMLLADGCEPSSIKKAISECKDYFEAGALTYAYKWHRTNPKLTREDLIRMLQANGFTTQESVDAVGEVLR